MSGNFLGGGMDGLGWVGGASPYDDSEPDAFADGPPAPMWNDIHRPPEGFKGGWTPDELLWLKDDEGATTEDYEVVTGLGLSGAELAYGGVAGIDGTPQMPPDSAGAILADELNGGYPLPGSPGQI